MSSRTFLLQECENVKDLLDKTLRYEYGIDSSRHFFDECSARLSFLTTQIAATAETDTSMLASWGDFLNELAALICRIERSSLGEFSWSFVEELKKIASAICGESTLTDGNAPPKIYVFAEGGLASYAIYTERKRPSAAKRRLLTIVFPKSLKHFVLLHTILGHELGHAIWQVSKHRNTLNRDVIRHLCKAGGPLESDSATAAWLYSASAPTEVRDYLATLPVSEADIFQQLNWDAWVEEILCDLIGLVTFGPGFIAAHSRLLYSVDPSGIRLGLQHPPVAWRVNMILAGAKLLGYDRLPSRQSPLRTPMERFWGQMGSFAKADSWYNFLPILQLQDALSGIKQLLEVHAPSSYPIPSSGRMAMLVRKLVELQPPVGNKIARDHLPKSVNIDFRHIIYAGWIATTDESNIPFKRVNQLCEHAIMQQRAIELSLLEPF